MHTNHRSHLLAMLGIAALAVLALLAAGRSLGEALPLAALLACPLMHLFGHGGHGGHGGGSDARPKDDARQLPPGGQGGHQH